MFKSGTVPSQLVALSALALLAVLPYAGVFVPLQEKFLRLDEAIAHQNETLSKYRQRSISRDVLETTLRRLRETNFQSDTYIKASTRSLAEAKLQQLVKRTIAISGGQLVSAQVVSANRSAPRKPVTMRTQIVIPIKGLKHMLYRLEAGKPYLFLNNISIRPDGTGQESGRRRNKSKGTNSQVVHVQYDVSGYLRDRPKK